MHVLSKGSLRERRDIVAIQQSAITILNSTPLFIIFSWRIGYIKCTYRVSRLEHCSKAPASIPFKAELAKSLHSTQQLLSTMNILLELDPNKPTCGLDSMNHSKIQ